MKRIIVIFAAGLLAITAFTAGALHYDSNSKTYTLDGYAMTNEQVESYIQSGSFTVSAGLSGLGMTSDPQSILKSSRRTNTRNEIVDRHLKDKTVSLPTNNYLLVGYQPEGIVESLVLIELDTRSVHIISGTHDPRPERVFSLTQAEYDYIEELISSGLMDNFPSKSGITGLGGVDIVIYSKSGEIERHISHRTANYIGIDIFTSIHRRFSERRANSRSRTPR